MFIGMTNKIVCIVLVSPTPVKCHITFAIYMIRNEIGFSIAIFIICLI